MTASIDDPLASGSGQLPLCAPAGTMPSDDEPSPVGLRPWGLRTVTDAPGGRVAELLARYDHDGQIAVDQFGTPVIDLPCAGRGDPTADTTSTVDGEDPPSSEDWHNDFHPDEPFQP